MRQEAEHSTTHESFQVIKKTSSVRIGVGARIESARRVSFFLEVLMRLCDKNGELEIGSLERKLSLLRALKAFGFAIKCDEGGDFSGEKHASPQSLSLEAEKLSLLLASRLERVK